MKISLIGFGNMGQAFYEGLKTEHEIFVTSKNTEVMTAHDVKNAEPQDIKESDYLILAIKPQQLNNFTPPEINKDTIIVSLLAGTKIDTIKSIFPHNRIIRCMPNLGIKNQNGILGWFQEALSPEAILTTHSLFDLLGDSLCLSHESLVENITLISGSGPGYLAYIAQILKEESERLGFSEQEALQMVQKTMEITAQLLTTQSPAELQAAVSSKGGITEAIIQNLKENEIEKVILDSLNAGKERNKNLNQ